MKAVALFLVLNYLAVLVSGDHEDCCFEIDTTTRQIIDVQGRARLFHGVNVVYKSFPYYPKTDSFNPELSLSSEDIKFLSSNGFNVVRLYVAWPGVEPTRHQYNDTYLNILVDIVNKLGEAGEGAPDYAALYMNSSVKPLPFPELFPELTAYKLDPKTGYPSDSDCKKHPFFTYYFSDAEGKAWQSFYDDEQGIQDSFLAFWGYVAKIFATNSYVLGYEIMNEPWAGDIYGHLDQVEPHVADKRNLVPLYDKVYDAISHYDDKRLLFFEPTQVFTSLPLKNFSSSGLTHGPGGPGHLDRQVFSYHMYCILMDKQGQPSRYVLCDLLDTDILDIRISDQRRLNVAAFMTEWGAYTDTSPGTKAHSEALYLLKLADDYLQSWAYWQYKGYGDFTTQSDIGEGLYYTNGSLNGDKLRLLTRTYAQAVTGRYLSQTFDPSTSDFNVTFIADPSIEGDSEIFLNEQVYYPNGYTVKIHPENAGTYKKGANQVTVTMNSSVKKGQVLSVLVYKQ